MEYFVYWKIEAIDANVLRSFFLQYYCNSYSSAIVRAIMDLATSIVNIMGILMREIPREKP